jgi:uncharacterized damage-inducible protein DinB
MTLSLNELVIADMDREYPVTRRVLERIPDDRHDWRPHDKSTPLGQLASHVASLPRFVAMILQQDGFDLAVTPPQRPPALRTREELLRTFDDYAAAARNAVQSTTDDALAREWVFRNGDQVFLRGTRATVIRTLAMNHLVHHRGQLSVYLRLLDVPVPSIYGPSADEPL